MQTSEQLTRFLRSKTDDIHSLLVVGRDVLIGKSTINLPQRHAVLLEWLLDRLKNTSGWSADHRVWELLHDVWIETDPNVRTLFFNKYTFTQSILVPTLEYMHDFQVSPNNKIPPSMISLVQAVSKVLQVIADEPNVTVLGRSPVEGEYFLSLSLECALHLGSELFAVLLRQAAVIVEPVLRRKALAGPKDESLLTEAGITAEDQLTKKEAFKLMSKARKKAIKSAAYLISLALACLADGPDGSFMHSFAIRVLESIFPPVDSPFNTTVTTTTTSTTSSNEIIIPVRLAIIEASHYRPLESVLKISVPVLFKIILNANRNASIYFKDISTKWPSLTTVLLTLMNESVSSNTTVSALAIESSAVQQVVITELTKSDANSVDWNSLRIVLNLNKDAVLVNLQEVLILLNRTSATSDITAAASSFALALLNIHSRPRDLPKFFVTWCSVAGSAKSIWTSRQLMDQFSQHLSKLSSHQLSVLISDVQHRRSSKVLPLLVLVDAVALWPYHQSLRLVDSLVPVILDDTNVLADPRVWELKYAILLLNTSVVEKSAAAVSELALELLNMDSADKQNNIECISYWCCLLRVYEVSPNSYDLSRKICKRLVKWLARHPEDLAHISRRWVLFIESYFDDKTIHNLANIYADPANSSSLLDLVTSNDQIFECNRVFSEILRSLIKPVNPSSSDPLWTVNQMHALSLLPIQVFSDEQIGTLLNVLPTVAMSSSSLTPLALQCMKVLMDSTSSSFTVSSSLKSTGASVSSALLDDPRILEVLYAHTHNENVQDSMVVCDLCSRVIYHAPVKYIERLIRSVSKRLDKKFLVKESKSNFRKKNIWIVKLACAVVAGFWMHGTKTDSLGRKVDDLVRRMLDGLLMVLSAEETYTLGPSDLASLFAHISRLLSSAVSSSTSVDSGNLLVSTLTASLATLCGRILFYCNTTNQESTGYKDYFVESFRSLSLLFTLDKSAHNITAALPLAAYFSSTVEYLEDLAFSEDMMSLFEDCVGLLGPLDQRTLAAQVVSLCMAKSSDLTAKSYSRSFAPFAVLKALGPHIVPYEPSSGPTDVDISVLADCLSRFVTTVSCSDSGIGEKEALLFLQFVDRIVRYRSRPILSQSCLELILSCMARIAGNRTDTTIESQNSRSELERHKLADSASCISRSRYLTDATFVAICDILGTLLVVDRARLSRRYHLIVILFNSLLSSLSSDASSSSSCGIPSASSYSRLVHALCNPPVAVVSKAVSALSGGSTHAPGATLVSSTQRIRQQLSRHIPALLGKYISLALNPGFSPQIRATLRPSLYNIFDILGPAELRTCTALMDNASRAVLRGIYDDYLKNGKWVEE